MLALLLGFIMFARGKIKYYLALANQYSVQIISLQSSLQQESADGLARLQELMAAIEPITTKMMLFTFVLVPLVFILLWCVSQLIDYTLISKGKWFSLGPLLRIVLLTVPFFLAFVWLMGKVLSLLSEELFSVLIDWRFYLAFIALVLLLYLAQVFYSFLFEKTLKTLIVKASRKSLFQFHKLFPLYLIYITILFVILVQMIGLFLKYTSSDFRGLILSSIALALVLLFWGWFRIFFTLQTQKA